MLNENKVEFYLSTGARAETSSRVKGASGYDTEGVRGLKALGVRDLTYKMAFLACNVSSSNPRVCSLSASFQELKFKMN